MTQQSALSMKISLTFADYFLRVTCSFRVDLPMDGEKPPSSLLLPLSVSLSPSDSDGNVWVGEPPSGLKYIHVHLNINQHLSSPAHITRTDPTSPPPTGRFSSDQRRRWAQTVNLSSLTGTVFLLLTLSLPPLLCFLHAGPVGAAVWWS